MTQPKTGVIYFLGTIFTFTVMSVCVLQCVYLYVCMLFYFFYDIDCHHLTSLQILKLYAWEPSYKKKIIEIREQELEVQKSAGYLTVFSMLTLTCIPFLVSVYIISCFDFQV